jgi:hypothetical protein
VPESQMILPIQVTGRVDVGRLLRETQAIDNFLKQAVIRQPGTPTKMPKTSRLLDDFLANNNLNLLHDDDRSKALNFLLTVRAKAPILHMSFSVDPSPAFTQKLMAWLRQNIHPLVLVQVGLQPNIGAGCVVRSTNKYFDFSLRQHFKKQRALLVDKLHHDFSVPVPAVATQAAAAPAPAAHPTHTDTSAEAALKQQVEAALAALPTTTPAASAVPAEKEAHRG